MSQREQGRERLFALDALRGVASLSVVVFHWRHFFYTGTEISPVFDVARLPFAAGLRLFYDYGFLAVDLFFGISGFVFFWLYGAQVASGHLTLRVFAIRRVSRLFPLHLATLAFVALGQQVMHRVSGSYFVYAWNDVRHFALNLFMVSSWGFEQDMSFNGPAWSVSVEVFLYGVFFLWARRLPRRAWLMLAGAALGRAMFHGYFPLGRGLWSFFIGAVIAEWFGALDAEEHQGTVVHWMPWVTALLWGATILWAYGGLAERIVPLFASVAPSAGGLADRLVNNWPRAILLPATIVSTLLLDRRYGARLRHLSILGEISYSSYLLHFPLQLLLMLTFRRFAGATTLYSPAALLGFLVLLFALSVFSYRAFERPVQDWMRRRFLA